jgi:SAM-dependent methyltransferase
MNLTKEEWHDRFTNQARWTQSLRQHLFRLAKLDQAQRVLEVGCGSGAVLREVPQYTRGDVFGLDIDKGHLNMAMRNIPGINLVQADAHNLPFAKACFDLTFCHFLLLWVAQPAQVLQRMKEVTRPGGFVAALAEPDYGGRIDYPTAFADLGRSQTQALLAQGADPLIGRQLRSLMSSLGLENVESGVLGGHWELPFDEATWESEWEVLESDLASDQDFQAEKAEQKAQDRAAWAAGKRVLYVPTFYAWGVVPD